MPKTTQPGPAGLRPLLGSRPRLRSAVLQYAVVLICITVAFAIRYSLTPLIIDYDPFMFFAPAALIAAWFGGVGPGIVAWVLGILVGDFFFTGPAFQFGPYGPVQITLIITYSVETLIGIALIEALHRLGRRAQQSAEDAHLRGERLEREMVERKKAEEALRLREEQLQLITDSLPVLISYIDKDQRYQFLNRQYETWFNLPRREAYGQHLKTIWGEKAYEEMRSQVEAAFQGQQVTYERWVENAKGHRCNQITYVPHRDEKGAVAGLFVLVSDITEQQQAEKALLQAQYELSKHAAELESRVAERTAKLKQSLDDMERLLYSVAHDLRAPLRAMEGFSTLLLKQYAPRLDEMGKDYARRVGEAATRMDQLILDLLAYGRLSHITLSCTPIELERSIDAVLLRLKDEIQARNADVQVERPLPAVWANATLLEQILLNLIANALKFVPTGTNPRVRIRSEDGGRGSVERESVRGSSGTASSDAPTLQRSNAPTPPSIRLWIEDNGIGIAPEHHERIFRLFERLHSSATYPGTGIGLAIVSKGMEKMKGRAGVESAPGEGSRFWLELQAPPPET